MSKNANNNNNNQSGQQSKGPHMSHDDPEMNQQIETTFRELMFEADQLDRATAEDVSSYLSKTRVFKFFDRLTGTTRAGQETITQREIDERMREQMEQQDDQMSKVNDGATVVQRSRAGAGMNTSVSNGYGAAAAASVTAPRGGDTSSRLDTSFVPQNEEEAMQRMRSAAAAAGGATSGAGMASAAAMGRHDNTRLPLANRLLFKKSNPRHVPLLARWWVPWVLIGCLGVIWTPDHWKLRAIYKVDYQYARFKFGVHSWYWRMTMDDEQYKVLMEQMEAGVPKSLRVKSTDCPL